MKTMMVLTTMWMIDGIIHLDNENMNATMMMLVSIMMNKQ